MKLKKNHQGTNSAGDEAKNQINDLEHKEGKSIQSEQQEEKITQKKKKRKERIGLGTSGTTSNIPTSES